MIGRDIGKEIENNKQIDFSREIEKTRKTKAIPRNRNS